MSKELKEKELTEKELTEKELKEKARLARNRYAREYRRKNPEKIKAINERYWVKKALKLEAIQKKAEK